MDFLDQIYIVRVKLEQAQPSHIDGIHLKSPFVIGGQSADSSHFVAGA